jgi:hypothetical protein
MVRVNRFPVVMAAVQAGTVAAIGLFWGSHTTVARFLLTPLLIVSFIVGLRSGLLLRDRLVRAVARAWRRWRYRWTVIRPVERGIP